MKKRYFAFLMSIFMLLSIGSKQDETETIEETSEVQEEMIQESKEERVVIEEPEKKDIVISAIGDCTLGTDTNFGYERSLPAVLDSQNRDFSYFFSGVYDILSNDNLTIANLETTFTNATERAEKTFNFKGDIDYTNILTEGSIEAVNLANNHTHDYKEKGYSDTIASLNKAGIPYFGYQDYAVLNIDGIKIGLAGLPGWNEATAKAETEKAIACLKEKEADLIIMTYHWGIEREYKQNATQENIARYAVELGADLVIGHHPHVVQGVECYQGKYIVYSLGNFVFGGNKNPKDKDTM
ncbi:MAG: CapA family protein, partial [Bacilli bacterium]|nr:CapA family protein [Bacilli bacterium]